MSEEIVGITKDSEVLYGESTQSKLKKKNLDKKPKRLRLILS